RPNVNVVTRDGMPARSIAPAIQPRTGGPAQADARVLDTGRQNDNGRNDRRAIDNSARMQNNPQVLREQQTGNPTLESRTVTGAPNGRTQMDERRALPSSRYVNPNAADNGQQRVLRGDNNNATVDTGRKDDRVQRDNRQEYRSTTVERAPRADFQQRQQEVQVQQQQQAQQRQEMQMRRQQDAEVQQRQQRQTQDRQQMQVQQQQQMQQRQEMQMRRQQDAEVQQRQQRQIQDRQQIQVQQQQQVQQRQEMQMRSQQQVQPRTETMRVQPQQQQQQQRAEQPQGRGRVQRDDNKNDHGQR
ncbi:hypothetical protein, partial [Rudaea sp.]|uniref:hypothetical protein n=1 Tax=Rudaea sp. TaxID=2136325 RepID=UPI002ED02BC1